MQNLELLVGLYSNYDYCFKCQCCQSKLHPLMWSIPEFNLIHFINLHGTIVTNWFDLTCSCEVNSAANSALAPAPNWVVHKINLGQACDRG